MSSSWKFGDDVPEDFRDPDQPVTDELLTKLAHALGIRWPDWYRRLIIACDGEPPVWLFESARGIYQHAMLARNGHITVLDWSNGTPRELPWPPHLVSILHTGSGDVFIDTTSESGEFFLHRLEGLAIEPFGNIWFVADTPEAAAAIMMATKRAEDAEHQRRLKQKQWEMANPIFRGPPPGT